VIKITRIGCCCECVAGKSQIQIKTSMKRTPGSFRRVVIISSSRRPHRPPPGLSNPRIWAAQTRTLRRCTPLPGASRRRRSSGSAGSGDFLDVRQCDGRQRGVRRGAFRGSFSGSVAGGWLRRIITVYQDWGKRAIVDDSLPSAFLEDRVVLASLLRRLRGPLVAASGTYRSELLRNW
jgi:hypothetical protein